jgi:hypothetical protein
VNKTRGLLCLALASLAVPAVALADDAAKAKHERITVREDKKNLTVQIFIEANKGRVSCADVLIGLARAHQYDDRAFADLIPNFTIDIRRSEIRLGIFLSNQTLPRGIRLGISRPGKAREPTLVITLDRVALLASKRKYQTMIRESIVKAMTGAALAKPTRYGLQLPAGWERAPPDKPLVVVVPGYQANAENTAGLVTALAEQGFLAGAFHYPNDQPIEDSARLLRRELAKLADKQTARKVRVLSFSMGGLVVRRVIEDPEWDPGNVIQLIMVGTPNHGSRLACFGFALELWEHLVESKEKDYGRKFYASVEDGLGEADEDLEPDSVFLTELNARPRNAKVRYTLFLGTGAFLTEKSLREWRRQYAKAAANQRLLRFFGPRLDALLADLDEVVRGKGDGAVALSRGKLAGISDIVVLEFNHLGISTEPRTNGDRRLRAEIYKRLKESLESRRP